MADKKGKIGDLLIKAGLIDQMQLNSALGHQKRFGGKLGKCLVEQGFIEEETMLRVLSQSSKMPAVDLSRSRIAPQTFSLLPQAIARKYEVVPVVVKETHGKKTLVLAMSDPSDLSVLDEVSFLTGLKLEPVLATDSAIAKVLSHYGDYQPEQAPEAFQDASPAELHRQSQQAQGIKPTFTVPKPAPQAPTPTPKPVTQAATPAPQAPPFEAPAGSANIKEGIALDDINGLELVEGEVVMLRTPPDKSTRPAINNAPALDMPTTTSDREKSIEDTLVPKRSNKTDLQIDPEEEQGLEILELDAPVENEEISKIDPAPAQAQPMPPTQMPDLEPLSLGETQAPAIEQLEQQPLEPPELAPEMEISEAPPILPMEQPEIPEQPAMEPPELAPEMEISETPSIFPLEQPEIPEQPAMDLEPAQELEMDITQGPPIFPDSRQEMDISEPPPVEPIQAPDLPQVPSFDLGLPDEGQMEITTGPPITPEALPEMKIEQTPDISDLEVPEDQPPSPALEPIENGQIEITTGPLQDLVEQPFSDTDGQSIIEHEDQSDIIPPSMDLPEENGEQLELSSAFDFIPQVDEAGMDKAGVSAEFATTNLDKSLFEMDDVATAEKFKDEPETVPEQEGEQQESDQAPLMPQDESPTDLAVDPDMSLDQPPQELDMEPQPPGMIPPDIPSWEQPPQNDIQPEAQPDIPTLSTPGSVPDLGSLQPPPLEPKPQSEPESAPEPTTLEEPPTLDMTPPLLDQPQQTQQPMQELSLSEPPPISDSSEQPQEQAPNMPPPIPGMEDVNAPTEAGAIEAAPTLQDQQQDQPQETEQPMQELSLSEPPPISDISEQPQQQTPNLPPPIPGMEAVVAPAETDRMELPDVPPLFEEKTEQPPFEGDLADRPDTPDFGALQQQETPKGELTEDEMFFNVDKDSEQPDVQTGEMKQVITGLEGTDELVTTEQQLDEVSQIGDDFLDAKLVREKIEKVSRLEQAVKEREFQFDDLLNLMMKKELGEITTEVFTKELTLLKHKMDESRGKKDSEN